MSNTYDGGGSKLLKMAALVGCSLFAAPYSVLAQDAPQGPSGHDPAAIYMQAGADKDQIVKIRQVAADFETKARASVKTLMTSVQEMQKLSLEPNLDEDKILATQDQINKVTSDMAIERMKLLINSRKLLTQDQRLELIELLKQRRAQAAPSGAPQ
jgi:Spy/CpxP family protein refolding chaperone